MSWSSRKVFGFIFGATMASWALVGCSGNAVIGTDAGAPNIPVTGGFDQRLGTSNESRAASTSPQQVQITSTSGLLNAYLPAGVTLATGDQVALFPRDSVFIDGITVIGGGRAPGDISLRVLPNGQTRDTGVKLLGNGHLSDNLILPNGQYEAVVNGPLSIRVGNQSLTVQTIVVRGWVRNGVASVPQTIAGQMPVNGGTTFGLRLNIHMTTPTFSNGYAALKVTHLNGLLFQQHQLVNGNTQFHDLEFTGSSRIPVSGVNTVEFSYSDTPITQ